VKLLVIGALVAGLLAGATDISDPEAFVAQVYRSIAANPSGYPPPSDMYTPRLQALFDSERKRSGGEVGCIDFDFWTNSQDPGGIRDIKVTTRPGSAPDRRTIVATFFLGRLAEIHFEFRRAGGRWLLDDASSHKGERWVLSRLLRCKI
jgi:hypothetical protein